PTSPMVQLQGQLQSNRAEIANRERAVTDLKAKVIDYQARLNQEPVREQELSDLTRGYEQSKANYDGLLKKKNESAMATSMELLQQGERFRIIDPPSLPGKPDFPNRLKFCGIGLGIGLALGVVVAGAFEMMDDRVYDEKELQKLLPITVISEIPTLEVAADVQRERRRFWLGWATAAFVVLTGEVGTGKTLLLRCLLQALKKSSDVAYAYVFNGRLSPVEFLQYIVTDFGLSGASNNKGELLLQIAHYVVSRSQKRLTTVLVVDEAHHLSTEILEEIRLLTNLETEDEKLLQILLVGQPELDDKLNSSGLRQLKQR